MRDVHVVEIFGDLDTASLPGHRARIDALMRSGVHRLVLDLQGLSFINSTALGFLLALKERLEGEGGALAIARPSTVMEKALRVLRLDEVFRIRPTVEEAVADLQGG